MLIKLLAALAYVFYGVFWDMDFTTIADVIRQVWVVVMLVMIAVLTVLDWRAEHGNGNS